MMSEKQNRVFTVPFMVYMPEKDRLLMLAGAGYPHQAVVVSSNDRGKTWTESRYVHVGADGKPDTGMGVALRTWEVGN